MRALLGAGLLVVVCGTDVQAQLLTIGGGVLVSNRPLEPVAEIHAETPPFLETRAYGTLSWTDDSWAPTVITAAERQVLNTGVTMTGLGAGLLWLDANDYRPYPILVSSTVIPLPVPRTSVVAIGSTQPLQDFEWSLVLKVGVTLWFRR
ncbi:MAG: hypothetical protein OEY20_10580 [Gemmatimonadota bacterium]|nr:hypothetical protein [Gemmatimonadota bacterium]